MQGGVYCIPPLSKKENWRKLADDYMHEAAQKGCVNIAYTGLFVTAEMADYIMERWAYWHDNTIPRDYVPH